MTSDATLVFSSYPDNTPTIGLHWFWGTQGLDLIGLFYITTLLHIVESTLAPYSYPGFCNTCIALRHYNSNFTTRILKEWGTAFTGVCLFTFRGGGTPSSWGGHPHLAMGGGYPHQGSTPSGWCGYSPVRTGWGYPPPSGLDGGTPLPSIRRQSSRVSTCHTEGGMPFAGGFSWSHSVFLFMILETNLKLINYTFYQFHTFNLLV